MGGGFSPWGTKTRSRLNGDGVEGFYFPGVLETRDGYCCLLLVVFVFSFSSFFRAKSKAEKWKRLSLLVVLEGDNNEVVCL